MPVNPGTSWWNATLWKTDPLYNEIAFGTSGMEFFLGHHTFTHENLNNVTYHDAEQQIRINQVHSEHCLPFLPLLSQEGRHLKQCAVQLSFEGACVIYASVI